MPKIIENVRGQLLEEAKRQIIQNGYAETTIRSIANACHFSVGTVYNYFASKDMLIATFMLDDWQLALRQMKDCSSDDPKSYLHTIYDALLAFIHKHQNLFQDSAAEKVFATALPERHELLCRQLASLIRPLCEHSSAEDKDFVARFIVESLLTWATNEEDFEKLYSVLGMLLK